MTSNCPAQDRASTLAAFMGEIDQMSKESTSLLDATQNAMMQSADNADALKNEADNLNKCEELLDNMKSQIQKCRELNESEGAFAL